MIFQDNSFQLLKSSVDKNGDDFIIKFSGSSSKGGKRRSQMTDKGGRSR